MNRRTMVYLLGGVGIVALVVLGIFVARRSQNEASSTPRVCDPAGWWASVQPQVNDFLNQAETTTQSTLMNLPLATSLLDTFSWDYANGDFSYCIYEAKADLRSGMRNVVGAFEAIVEQDAAARDIRFELANQYFWMAADEMKRAGITDYDPRLEMTDRIWGGKPASAVKATEHYTSPPTNTPTPVALGATATP